MLSKQQAEMVVEKKYPGAKAQASILYRNLYVVRVLHPEPDEQSYDPFFSVNPSTGEAKEFSVLTDGDVVEIAALFALEPERR